MTKYPSPNEARSTKSECPAPRAGSRGRPAPVRPHAGRVRAIDSCQRGPPSWRRSGTAPMIMWPKSLVFRTCLVQMAVPQRESVWLCHGHDLSVRGGHWEAVAPFVIPAFGLLSCLGTWQFVIPSGVRAVRTATVAARLSIRANCEHAPAPCPWNRLTRFPPAAILAWTIEPASVHIPEQGANPWRARRCNRGQRVASRAACVPHGSLRRTTDAGRPRPAG